MTSVAFFFDLVSPYSWLALMQSDRFADEHSVRWELHPVVYAALLNTHGLLGPAEVPAKRRYTFQDVARAASGLGLRFVGPPEHPFRSLEALRTVQLFLHEPQASRLAIRLSDVCWGEGRSLTDPGVVADVVREVGLDAADLTQRIAEPAVKQALRESTDGAVERGIFGVPTFALGDELFWGHDRLPQLAARLAGEIPAPGAAAERMLARPQGVQRKRARRE